jgi:hypothetical protein
VQQTAKNSANTRAVIDAIGCKRGGRFTFPASSVVAYVIPPVREVYKMYFSNQFEGPNSLSDHTLPRPPSDARPQGASIRQNFERNDGCSMFGPLLLSILLDSSGTDSSCAHWENQVRSISEQLLLDVFSPLPFSLTGTISRDNMEKATAYAHKIGKSVPFRDLFRALPKGSIGHNNSRYAHEDDNAALIPCVWTSLLGSDTCTLSFYSKSHEFRLRTSASRFCLFQGWIPHSSGPVTSDHGHKSSNTPVRIQHHSGYSKPLIEFVSLSLFEDRESMEDAINSM